MIYNTFEEVKYHPFHESSKVNWRQMYIKIKTLEHYFSNISNESIATDEKQDCYLISKTYSEIV